MSAFDLSDRELERYSRQLVVPEMGGEGQMRLKSANVLVIGAGALGSPAAGYLAAAGVGRVGIVDSDTVELANLQRQLLHFPPDIGQNKAESASYKLGVLNPEIVVEPYPVHLDEQNAAALVADRSVVLDCSDTIETRYRVNDACVGAAVPLVEAGVLGLDGIVMTILPGLSACYRCAFPDPPAPGSLPGCAELGALGPLGGIVGSLQALEAIKLIAGLGQPLTDRVLQIEGRDLTFTTVRVTRRAECPACAAAAVGASMP